MLSNFIFSLKNTFLVFFLSLIFTHLYADLVSTVYRADSRNYQDVFSNGFISWGNNINFNAHILGLSTARGSHDSAFISTTVSYQMAEQFAHARVVNQMQPYYIYNIRPTDNFYSASATMYHLYTLHNGEIDAFLRYTLAREQEYAAYGYISPQQIRSAIVITYINGSYRTMTVPNPNYVDNITYANSNPYTGADGYSLDHRPRLLFSPDAQPASFLSDPDDTDTQFHLWTLCSIFCGLNTG